MAPGQKLNNFFVLEGIDGAGRSTQLALLKKALEAAGHSVWATSEPTRNEEGQLIRKILGGEIQRDPATLATLFAADRNEHLDGAGGILFHLTQGDLVICDRYLFSSLAYQGLDCGEELPRQLNARFPFPQLLLYYNIGIDLALSRLEARGGRTEIYETRPRLAHIRQRFDKILEDYESQGLGVFRLDASLSQETLARKGLEAIKAALRR